MYLGKGTRDTLMGILTLAIGAITLLFIFRGNTESLIPLFILMVYLIHLLFSNGDGYPLICEHKGFWKQFLY